MEAGLAQMYGSGEGNTVTHSYGGTMPMNTKKKGTKKMACKTKKKPGKK